MSDTTNIDIAQARAQLGRIVTATGEGQVFVITRYGKPVAELRTYSSSATVSSISTQMDPVDASSPTRRATPEPPEHRMQQQQRDDILRGVNRKSR